MIDTACIWLSWAVFLCCQKRTLRHCLTLGAGAARVRVVDGRTLKSLSGSCHIDSNAVQRVT